MKISMTKNVSIRGNSVGRAQIKKPEEQKTLDVAQV